MLLIYFYLLTPKLAHTSGNICRKGKGKLETGRHHLGWGDISMVYLWKKIKSCLEEDGIIQSLYYIFVYNVQYIK
jgi:hypothetical protein